MFDVRKGVILFIHLFHIFAWCVFILLNSIAMRDIETIPHIMKTKIAKFVLALVTYHLQEMRFCILTNSF